jgi:hypothetical protein
MIISAYQINNVMRVYRDQLNQSRISNKQKNTNALSSDKVSISADARKKSIIDKTASNIIERITQSESHDDAEKTEFSEIDDEYDSNPAKNKKRSTELIFKAIDENGETLNSLSIEDSNFLSYKLKKISEQSR